MTNVRGKRVSAKEAAEILGVPYQNISRIDRQGEFIKRYRLGHKTFVYELESLYAFLDAKLVRPIPKPTLPTTRAVRGHVANIGNRQQQSSLREFLTQALKGTAPNRKRS